MDNAAQIEEMKKYGRHLTRSTGIAVPDEVAAAIWVRKYARVWRLKHGAIPMRREFSTRSSMA